MMLQNKRILLIISGGIAAVKAPALISLLRKDGAKVSVIMTKNAEQFVTPLSIQSLTEEGLRTELFDPKQPMDHIYLTRDTDLIIVAPATANLMAKMVHGIADDLASATLLAKNKPVIVCPAMNGEMWDNDATQANIEALSKRADITLLGPATGGMACGETGTGRMVEPDDIFKAVQDHFRPKSLAGLHAIVTSGPTHEPIDPVRFIGNRSSGKQGHAIAKALADLGATVTLVSGPTDLPAPKNIKTVRIETAAQMLASVQSALPADIFVAAAAVADWTPTQVSPSKMKKTGDTALSLDLVQTPDILSTISSTEPSTRPRLVVGFAAETNDTVKNAQEKLIRKGCDWIVANSVSSENPVFGSDQNQVYFVASGTVEEWPKMGKDDVARKLAQRIEDHFQTHRIKDAAE
jgi:phosphopantothenoylcysteine decarboxylase/phosphopantothenate--cysteine ligase